MKYPNRYHALYQYCILQTSPGQLRDMHELLVPPEVDFMSLAAIPVDPS